MVATASLDWLQTLADATRVRLLRLLDQEELAVTELCSVLQLPQSTVSRHLKLLIEDRWISNRRDGTNQLYRTDRDHWTEARSSLWSWVRSQADSPTTEQDQRRLSSVLAERSRSEIFFSSAAEQWDKLRVELFGRQLDAVALAASLPDEAAVAELGCGSAPICKLVAPFVKSAYAIDNSAAMLSAAKAVVAQHPNVYLHSASLTELPIQDSHLDVAWLVVVLAYLSEPVAALREAARVLKPGCSLVIVDLLPHDRAAYRIEMGHLRLGVDRLELLAWLSEAGLEMKYYHVLAPDAQAKGPALFSAVARRAAIP
jgi:ubiquinone/menaquinone biosynthesis C-methylase UbiE